MTEPTPAAKPTSKLAITALVISMIGFCCWPLSLVGAIIGIVALFQISKDASKGGQPLAILAMCVFPVALVVNGVLAAIAIPAFINYVKRSKAVEVSTTFEQLYAGIGAYAEEHGTLPPAMGPFPSSGPPSDLKQPFRAEDRAALASIHVASPDTAYYVYRLEPEADGSLTVVATGDLDGDGITSRFTMRVVRDATGRVDREAIRIENELE